MKSLQESYDSSIKPFIIRGFWEYPIETRKKKRELREKKLKRIYGKLD